MFRHMSAALLVLALTAPLAQAESMEQSLIRQLEAQGYTTVSISRTLLGRLYVVAEAGKIRREIVINPSTGEILRDYLREPSRLATIQRERGGDGEGRATAVTAVDLPERAVTDSALGGTDKGVGVSGDVTE